jgi:shikimate dehydrogenase
MKLYGLIGYPLGHSFSKKYFTEKFEKEGLTDCSYELFPIESISRLAKLIQDFPELKGLNVTVPYKKSVLGYLDSTTGLPPGLSACNCIKIENGRLTGYNTDCQGFEKSFGPFLKEHHKKALVLGQGGAAEAVVFVLKKLGIAYSIVSRSLHGEARFIYSDIDEKIMQDHTIIINTTPLGMYPEVDDCPALPYQSITERHLLFDLIYNPAKTLFLKRGEQMGATISNGEEMLKSQAEESWRIWNKASAS